MCGRKDPVTYRTTTRLKRKEKGAADVVLECCGLLIFHFLFILLSSTSADTFSSFFQCYAVSNDRRNPHGITLGRRKECVTADVGDKHRNERGQSMMLLKEMLSSTRPPFFSVRVTDNDQSLKTKLIVAQPITVEHATMSFSFGDCCRYPVGDRSHSLHTGRPYSTISSAEEKEEHVGGR